MPTIEGVGRGSLLQHAGAPVSGTDEVQTLTIGGAPTGGTFQLRFEGICTAAISWTDTDATLLARLNAAFDAHPSLGVGGVVATAGTLNAGVGTITLTFGSARGKQAIGSLISVEANSLTGAAPTLAIAETTPGVEATHRGAPVAAVLVDTTNGQAYQNTGTAAAPTWTELIKADQASETEIGRLKDVTPGTAAASKAAVLGADTELDEFHTAALYLGAGAGTLIAPTAAQINALVRGTAAGKQIIDVTVTLGGANPTRVNFQGADVAATILGTADEPFALDNGQTLIVNPDGAGDDTVTFAAAAGKSTSDAAPSTDLSLGTDNRFNISVDGDAAEEVALNLAACTTGANIATDMQSKIQALGGNKAAVTVAFSGGLYVITSGTKGTASAVVVTNGATQNCADDLKIGTANAGVETAGTGDAANIAAATAAEVAAAITAGATGWSAAAVGTKVRVTSDTTGAASSLAVNAASTADVILGITGTDYGEVGLGLPSDMSNTTYRVVGSQSDAAAAGADTIRFGGKQTSGFSIYCETAGSTDDYDLIIIGTPA